MENLPNTTDYLHVVHCRLSSTISWPNLLKDRCICKSDRSQRPGTQGAHDRRSPPRHQEAQTIIASCASCKRCDHHDLGCFRPMKPGRYKSASPRASSVVLHMAERAFLQAHFRHSGRSRSCFRSDAAKASRPNRFIALFSIDQSCVRQLED